MNAALMTTSLPRTQAVILAGGRGERLFPLTASRPKPAIPFGGGFRIVDFTLLNCLNSQLDQVAMLTQYRHEDLHAHIRQRWSESWNVPGQRSRQLICLPPTSGKRYRGTADAVSQNLRVIEANQTENVLVLSGDHVYEMDYRELIRQHTQTNADVTIATVEHPIRGANHFGVVEVDEDLRVAGFQEKPPNPRPLPSRPEMALISMGVYVFKTNVLIRSLIAICEGAFGYDFGHHIIPSLIGSSRVYAFDFRDEAKDSPRYWRDIGTIDSYYQASMDWITSDTSFRSCTPHGVRVSANACVSQSVLSHGVTIEAGASVEACILMPGVHVGSGARLRRVIVDEGVHIPADVNIGWDSDRDRKHYTMSPEGVVVITEAQQLSKPAVRFVLEAAVSDVTRPAVGNPRIVA